MKTRAMRTFSKIWTSCKVLSFFLINRAFSLTFIIASYTSVIYIQKHWIKSRPGSFFIHNLLLIAKNVNKKWRVTRWTSWQDKANFRLWSKFLLILPFRLYFQKSLFNHRTFIPENLNPKAGMSKKMDHSRKLPLFCWCFRRTRTTELKFSSIFF